MPAAYSFSIDASYAPGEFIYQDEPSRPYVTNQQNTTTNNHHNKRDTAQSSSEHKAKEQEKQYYGQCFEQATTVSTTQRPLVVLMSWLEAKEKHIEKYRQYWLERGYDVLNVKTSPLDLLLPTIGAKKISEDFVKFLLDKQYKHIILHGFSVGGYQFGEFLVQLDNHEEQIGEQVRNSIKGIVFDSLVPFEGTCIGVSRSITSNPILAKIIERLLNLYLLVCRSIATKHYLKASEKVWGGPLRCPTLFIVSEDDPISDINIIKRLNDVWKNFGVDTRMEIFKSSPHVQHFIKHEQQYVKVVDEFLEKIDKSSNSKNEENLPPGA